MLGKYRDNGKGNGSYYSNYTWVYKSYVVSHAATSF